MMAGADYSLARPDGYAAAFEASSPLAAGSHTWTFQANASAAASVAIRSAVMTVQEV